MRPDWENYVIKRSNFNHYKNTLKKNYDACKMILLQKCV